MKYWFIKNWFRDAINNEKLNKKINTTDCYEFMIPKLEFITKETKV